VKAEIILLREDLEKLYNIAKRIDEELSYNEEEIDMDVEIIYVKQDTPESKTPPRYVSDIHHKNP